MVGVHRIAHAARYLHPQHQCIDHLATGRTQMLTQRQSRRGHRPRRVDDGFEVGVVKVKGVRADAVEQGGIGHIDTLFAAQQGGLGGRLQFLHSGQGSFHGFMGAGTHGAASPVGKGAVGLLLDLVAPAFGGVLGDKFGQQRCHGGGIGVGLDGGVACGHG